MKAVDRGVVSDDGAAYNLFDWHIIICTFDLGHELLECFVCGLNRSLRPWRSWPSMPELNTIQLTNFLNDFIGEFLPVVRMDALGFGPR